MAIYVHIGLPRSGSTTLQSEVFPVLESVVYLGIGRSNVPDLDISSSLFSRLWKGDDQEFEHISSEWAGKVNRALDYANSVGKDVVVSFEGWCRPSPNVSLDELADRISKVFRNPTIIFLLRRPTEWLQSCYSKVLWNQFRSRDPSDPIDLSTIDKYYQFIVSNNSEFFGDCGLEPLKVVSAFSRLKTIVMPSEHLMATNFESINAINPNWVVSNTSFKKHNVRQGPVSMWLAKTWFRCPPWLRKLSRAWILDYGPRLDQRLQLKDNSEVNSKIRREIKEKYEAQLSEISKVSAVNLDEYNYCCDR